MRFQEKVAVVTGGNRGIGKAIVLAFAKEGASVALCGTNEATLKETSEEAAKAGIPTLWRKVDVSRAEEMEKFSAEVLEAFGKVDVLVNNAGITRDNLLVRMSEKDWDDVLTTNLKSIFLSTKYFVKSMMKARQGRIVNMASIVGVRGNAGQANYAASKAGIIGLTKTVAREFASRNVTCNAVAPGFIQTDMLKGVPEPAINQVKAMTPMGRLGTPEEVADAIVFLASPRASFITGQVLAVNGGMYM